MAYKTYSAEYGANAIQNIQPNAPVIFGDVAVPYESNSRGFVYHRTESGIFLLASVIPNPIYSNQSFGCGCCNVPIPETLYLVTFSGNIAVPTGETVGEISLGIAIDGEIDDSSIMRTTPTVVETYDSVSTQVLVSVPAICGCQSISVRNLSGIPINSQNANLVIAYNGVRY